MKPIDRQQWIEAWMREGTPGREFVDILNTDFVCAYAEATKARVKLVRFGAPKCKQLAGDLGAMFAAGKLTRSATGLPSGDSSMGFPKWIYSYGLPA